LQANAAVAATAAREATTAYTLALSSTHLQ
jgi:hypothetical protein